MNKKIYILILILSIQSLSFSQINKITVKSDNDDSIVTLGTTNKSESFCSPSFSLLGNFMIIHSNDYSGWFNLTSQLNIIKLKNLIIGINFDFCPLKDQNSINFNLYNLSVNSEYKFFKIARPSLDVSLIGEVGYYYEKSKDGLSYGFGCKFISNISPTTQLLISVIENILDNNFNYMNLGIGFRRYI